MTYELTGVSPNMTLLEVLDVLNEKITLAGQEPVAFEHDCREGVCGSCGLVINGLPHATKRRAFMTTCQLRMREFRDGAIITIEPYRSAAFPVIKDLIVDRSALDRVIQVGGFVSTSVGAPSEANIAPVSKRTTALSMMAAACIGCGACVAVCPNASAMLFVGAKAAHLNPLPAGQPERHKRVTEMVRVMDEEGFGGCTNTGECTAICPEGIACSHVVSQLNRDFIVGRLFKGQKPEQRPEKRKRD